MGKHVNSRPVTIRLPNELADVVDDQAEASGSSRNDFLVRRIRTSLRVVSENRKKADINRSADDELPPLEDD